MIDSDGFKQTAHELADWLTEYFNKVEEFPIVPNVQPGDIEECIPKTPPFVSENVDNILNDFKNIIMPGITHWQHPGFHAYFPANNSYPSVLAEMLTAGLGVQGMKWVTSPSATELEKVIMRWLQQMLGLQSEFKGVLMDTASVGTMCAILAARERVTTYAINSEGFKGRVLRVYCSEQAHSSIDKAVRIAGIGINNLIKIAVDSELRMIPECLASQISSDISDGYMPCCVVGALGTTGTGAVDPLQKIGEIAKKNDVWFHVDAAYSGSALVLPEFREKITGIDMADSFVFNPHKWLFTNFDCSAFFVRNHKELVKTFSLVPTYLQTENEDELDYSNWGIQLGRRFRALKLWFVIRSFGVEGIQKLLRRHIKLGERFENYIVNDSGFELVRLRNLNVVCFRMLSNKVEINEANKTLLEKINQTGKIFLSHTIIENNFVLRFVCGQTNVAEKHIDLAWKIIKEISAEIR